MTDLKHPTTFCDTFGNLDLRKGGGDRINYDHYDLGICVPLGYQPVPLKKVIK